MKRFLALLLCVLMICSISLAFAADEAEGTDVAPATTDAEPAPAAEEPAATADEPAADADTEDDFPYEWSSGAEQNDNHFGFVQVEPDNKTHELVEKLNNYVELDFEVKPGEEIELVVPEPIGDDLDGLTYKWSCYYYNGEESIDKDLENDTDTITTDPIPSTGVITYFCTLTDKFGNTATCRIHLHVKAYEIDPAKAEYVKGSGEDLVFTVTSVTGKESLIDGVQFLEFDFFTGEYEKFDETNEEYPKYDWVDLSMDYLSEDEEGLKVTLPAEFLDEYEHLM